MASQNRQGVFLRVQPVHHHGRVSRALQASQGGVGDEACQGTQQRALARAGGTSHQHEVTGLDGEGEAASLTAQDPALAVAHRQVIYLDHGQQRVPK